MSNAELKQLIIEETKDLSTDILVEVLDFIEFLKIKKGKSAGKKSFEKKLTDELSELNKTSLVHLEEEFANYKELYPREQ